MIRFVGNDVVDFALASVESNWRRTDYLSKIFTEKEQKHIHESENQSNIVWQLWSQKEAVYKLIRQMGAPRGFYPLKIEGSISNDDFQEVVIENKVFYCQTNRDKHHLHTMAYVNKQQAQCVKNIPADSKIIKIGEFPFLKIAKKKLVPISKSHHGKYEYRVGIF